ncbi:thioredoxin family protein [Xylocopilactobacillus apis]|nr:thioredoxin family protein [Xylocopilactobacillus apis]
MLTFGSFFIFVYLNSAHSENSNLEKEQYANVVSNFDFVSSQEVKNRQKKKGSFVVFFGSKDCGPCLEAAPSVLKNAKFYSLIDKIYYVNINDSTFFKDANEYYGITGTPTIMVFKKGKVVSRITGSSEKIDDIVKGAFALIK